MGIYEQELGGALFVLAIFDVDLELVCVDNEAMADIVRHIFVILQLDQECAIDKFKLIIKMHLFFTEDVYFLWKL